MIWLVLRRQRAALLLAAALVVLCAAALVTWRALFLADTQALGLARCLAETAPPCEQPAWYRLQDTYNPYWSLMHVTLICAPAVLGMLAGAGLFGRELDQGTHVFALTQSVGRLRWWLTGLLVAGLPIAVAAGALTVLAGWALEPFRPFRQLFGAELTTPRFEVTGIVPVGHTLLAFAVAASVGFVLRSALAAVVVTVVVQIAVLIALAGEARPRYLPPVAETTALAAGGYDGQLVTVPDGAWILDIADVDAQGRAVPMTTSLADCYLAATTEQAYFACQRAAGVVGTRVRYHPADRYWPFQRIETGIVVALAAGALALGFVGLRRRVH